MASVRSDTCLSNNGNTTAYQVLNGSNGDEAMEITEDDANPENSTANGNGQNKILSLVEQKKAISELSNAPLVLGASWFLVDARWLKQWKRYVGYEDDMWGPEPVGSAADNPGPIDNSNICVDSVLKAHLHAEVDYCLLPVEAWNNLVSWYGVADSVSPIERSVIEIGTMRRTMVEVHRQEIKLCEADCETLVKREFSRMDTLHRVCAVAKEVFQYPADSKCRLWTFLTDYELVGDLAATLDEADVTTGDRIMIERQQPDGKWPRATTAAETEISSANDRNSSAGAGNTVGQARSSSYGTTTGYSSGSSYYSYSSSWSAGGSQQRSPGGLCGLSNLGNTCFMNSALQCMSNTRLLTRYLLADRHVDEINVDNPLGMQGQIATSYARLLKEIWSGGHASVNPREFKSAVSRFAPQFSGYAQHDSQELLAFLLDGLHEDLNRIRKKPYVELKDSDGRDDRDVAAEAWRAHRLRNDSVIVDMFQGQFKSRLVCPVCSKVSVTFDPFMFLSLPLPIKKTRQVEVTLVYLDPMVQPKVFNLSVPKRGTVKNLIQELEQRSAVPAERLACADVYNHRFHKIFGAAESLSHILDRDIIFAYELERPGGDDEDHVALPVYHREVDAMSSQTTYYYSHSHVSHTLFGFPFFVTVPRRGSTYRSLHDKIMRQLSRFVKPERVPKVPVAAAATTAPGDEPPAAQDMRSDDDESTPATPAEVGGDVKIEDAGDEVPDLVDADSPDGSKATAADPAAMAAGAGENLTTPDLFSLSAINSYGGTSLAGLTDDDSELDLTGHTYLGLDWDESLRKLAYDEEEADKCDSQENGTDAADATPRKIQLTDCLKLFTTEEQLGEDDPWYCPQCKEHRQAMKKFDIWRLPKVLVIHLKRFSYTRFWRDKLDTMVHFPVSGLDLGELTLGPTDEKPAVYDLHAVSNHFGGLGGGHYTAYSLHHDKQKWYDFDDSTVSAITGNELVSSNAYVLFYTRRDAGADADTNGDVAGGDAADKAAAADDDVGPPSAASSAASSEDTLPESGATAATTAASASNGNLCDNDDVNMDEESAEV